MDVIIVGSGISGLFSAYRLSLSGFRVLIISPDKYESSSYRAQGGIAAPVAPGDTVDSHVEDTLSAGDGLCDEERVRQMIIKGREIVLELLDMGFPFDISDDGLSLSREGGHSFRRILHSGGARTGKHLVEFFLDKLKDRVSFFSGRALDIVEEGSRVRGVVVWDGEGLHVFYSRAVIVASGGYASLYKSSTNPPTSNGFLMYNLYEKGLPIENLEFIQFHPTVFHAPDGKRILITEAIRGDGAILLNEKGERFVNETDTRDKVAREIARQKKVYLYAGRIPKDKILHKYGFLYESLGRYGYDLTRDMIPISPAAHYTIGGIKTDLTGYTPIEGLFVIGEMASTRVHGANRLASNSLLESLVMADSASSALSNMLLDLDYREISYFPHIRPIPLHPDGLLDTYAFIERDGDGLRKGLSKAKDGISRLILESALWRRESRGVHYRGDHPFRRKEFEGYLVWRKGSLEFEPIKLAGHVGGK